ncbi:hypothetical protein [Bradyrhizobium tropiciagri]|uniref:hypothetical protein n=1 Tax=Bradyrhizobium tropiciagri TaxID=312253 RepID=UPI00067D3186|nr:hypothetical protein [Bradyrhizobium tropiciagri]
MGKHFIVTVVYSTLSLIVASGVAQAETVGRYECSVIGAASHDVIGGDWHLLRSLQYSCFGVEGLLKGAVYTGSSISEWDGLQGTYLSAGGVVRAPGGLRLPNSPRGLWPL